MLAQKTSRFDTRTDAADQHLVQLDFEILYGLAVTVGAATGTNTSNGAHASPEKLGLPDPVTSVHINCAYVYKKTPDRLVLNWQGVFFDAVRQRSKHKN